MENRGYEEDSLNIEDHRRTAQEQEVQVDVTEPPDTHVYEDIIVEGEKQVQSVFDNHLEMNCGAWIPPDDLHLKFQRNLTLPLRKNSAFNKEELTRYSVRVTSTEKNPISRENKQSDDSLMEMGEKPRRRRKKDCKHCKMKANEETKIMPQRYVDKTVEPIFTLPEGRLPSFRIPGQNGCCVNSCTVFAIASNGQVGGICGGGFYDSKSVNYERSEVEPRLMTLEENSALLTPPSGIHRTGMKVNSIYQDQWRVKNPGGFIGDFKEQQSFQVRAIYILQYSFYFQHSTKKMAILKFVIKHKVKFSFSREPITPIALYL